jgi:hypothetical protein
MQKQGFTSHAPWRVVIINPIHQTETVRTFRRRETAKHFFEHHRRSPDGRGEYVFLQIRFDGRWVDHRLSPS